MCYNLSSIIIGTGTTNMLYCVSVSDRGLGCYDGHVVMQPTHFLVNQLSCVTLVQNIIQTHKSSLQLGAKEPHTSLKRLWSLETEIKESKHVSLLIT